MLFSNTDIVVIHLFQIYKTKRRQLLTINMWVNMTYNYNLGSVCEQLHVCIHNIWNKSLFGGNVEKYHLCNIWQKYMSLIINNNCNLKVNSFGKRTKNQGSIRFSKYLISDHLGFWSQARIIIIPITHLTNFN